MTILTHVTGQVIEGSDRWNLAQLAVPYSGSSQKRLLTPADVNDVISLGIFQQGNPTAVYSTTFSKTLSQSGGPSPAIHAADVTLWGNIDTIGHCFAHKVAQADVGASTLLGGRTYDMVYRIPTTNFGTLRAIFTWIIRASPV